MPNNWIFGSITGVFVDAKDQIWVTHLPETLTEEETSETQKPPIGTCCRSAPTVVVFDQAGNVVNSWGDPAQDIARIRAIRTGSSSITRTTSGLAPTCIIGCRSSRATAST